MGGLELETIWRTNSQISTTSPMALPLKPQRTLNHPANRTHIHYTNCKYVKPSSKHYKAIPQLSAQPWHPKLGREANLHELKKPQWQLWDSGWLPSHAACLYHRWKEPSVPTERATGRAVFGLLIRTKTNLPKNPSGTWVQYTCTLWNDDVTSGCVRGWVSEWRSGRGSGWGSGSEWVRAWD
jgi:hypothetical protein